MNLKKTMAALVAGVMSVSAVATLAVSAQDELKAETALYSQVWDVEAKGVIILPKNTTAYTNGGAAALVEIGKFDGKVTDASYVSKDLTLETIKANNFVTKEGKLYVTAAGASLLDKLFNDSAAPDEVVLEVEYSFSDDDVNGDGDADKKKNAAKKLTPSITFNATIAGVTANGTEVLDLTAKDVNCDWTVAELAGNPVGSMLNDDKTIKNWFEIEEIFGASKGEAEYWTESDTDERYKAVVNDINKNMRGYSDVTLTVIFSKDEEAEDVELKTNDYDNNGKDGADGASADLALRLNRTKALIGYAEFDKETMSCSFNLADIMGLSNIDNPVGLIDTLEFAFPKSSDLDGYDDNDSDDTLSQGDNAEYYWHSIVVSAPASDDELDQLDKDLAAGEAETTVEATLPAATTAAATTAADAAATTAAGAASTDAANNPSTGNSAVALAVIPVAIAAAAFVAKKRG